MDIVKRIGEVFDRNGKALYGGEAVTQTQHALQCATLAEQDGASPELITASLLHDIGHVLDPEFEAALEREEDLYHEDIGEAFLADWFGDAVTQPVKLHVGAKRYLCAVDETYKDKLSPASLQTLRLQGGPMTADEVLAFENNGHHRAAVQLRIWDDRAKDPGQATPGIDHFMEYVRQSLKP